MNLYSHYLNGSSVNKGSVRQYKLVLVCFCSLELLGDTEANSFLMDILKSCLFSFVDCMYLVTIA